MVITIRVDFSLFPFESRNVVLSVSNSIPDCMVFLDGGCGRIVLFRIPDKLISVTLSLSGSWFISIFSSSRLVSDLVGSGWVIWLSGVDNCIMFGLVGGWLCSYNTSEAFLRADL